MHPNCPTDYILFSEERGFGPLNRGGLHFYFEQQLVSAERNYFGDSEIYAHGASGDVMIFGWDSMGTAYGFDTGDGWQLVQVDEYRQVEKLDISFANFVRGLLVCYPQVPMRFGPGGWYDLGTEPTWTGTP